MKCKRIMSLMLASVMAVSCLATLSACKKSENDTETTPPTEVPAVTIPADQIVRPEVNPEVKNDTENKVGYQLEKPEDGDEIAIIHTSMGDITLRLFPENAPKAVENFVTLSREGKYDGSIFHRVIDNFMIQGSDYENANGTGGKSAFGEPFEDEFCDTLYNIRGSVAMANSGKNTNGSQFFINQAKADRFSLEGYDYDSVYTQMYETYNQFIESYGEEIKESYPTLQDFINKYCGGINPLSYAITDEVAKLYTENGGNIHLDGALRASGGHTVFAQVIEGMEVVDAISAVEVDANTNKPVKDVTIDSVEITTYYAQ